MSSGQDALLTFAGVCVTAIAGVIGLMLKNRSDLRRERGNNANLMDIASRVGALEVEVKELKELFVEE